MYEIGKAEIEAVAKVIRSGKLMRDFGGQDCWCERLEAALAKKVGVKYAVTTVSGTTALTAGLLGLGIGPGDEVIVPAYTFMATPLTPLAVGAVPILAEVNETLTIDPADVERKITRHTRAIMPVHMIGRPCDMSAIMRIARKHKLHVVEDACQAVGGSYRGKRLGSMGHVGAFSFNFYKNISCGEGGVVLTDRRSVFERTLIYHDGALTLYTSAKKPRETLFAGSKFRFTEVLAAIMLEQLKRLDGILARLRARAGVMRTVFAKSDRFTLNPDNDIEGDCGSTVPVLFETAKEALRFIGTHKKRVDMARPYDTGKHMYPRWEPILLKRGSHHPALNPYKFARRKIKYSKDMCPRTLDITARTVNIAVPYKATVAEVRALARKLAQ